MLLGCLSYCSSSLISSCILEPPFLDTKRVIITVFLLTMGWLSSPFLSLNCTSLGESNKLSAETGLGVSGVTGHDSFWVNHGRRHVSHSLYIKIS